MSQVTSHSRKRKANQRSPSKTPEQGEIDYLKLELNAVRTQVIELESSKTDLESTEVVIVADDKKAEADEASATTVARVAGRGADIPGIVLSELCFDLLAFG